MKQIDINELKTLIANRIKEIGLNDVLDNSALENIKNKIMGKYTHEKAKSAIPEMIPEALESPVSQELETSFASNENPSIEINKTDEDGTMTPGQNVDQGTTGNVPSYTPILPTFLEEIEPAKIIIFSQNELSEGGENLSNKPLRTFSDPDIKKSMHDFWANNGQKKAEVYMVKLEKIGELDFNYANGTTVFSEKRFEPDFELQSKYKENPYAAEHAMDGVQDNGDAQIINQITTAVDLQQVARDVVMDMLKKQLNGDYTNNFVPGPNAPRSYVSNDVINPSTPPNPSLPISENLEIKTIDLIENFNKIDLPTLLKESWLNNDNKFLNRENLEIQEWLVEGNLYYTPINRISNKKCYVKPLI